MRGDCCHFGLDILGPRQLPSVSGSCRVAPATVLSFDLITTEGLLMPLPLLLLLLLLLQLQLQLSAELMDYVTLVVWLLGPHVVDFKLTTLAAAAAPLQS